mgnify:CR=1 FL=1
MSEQDTQGTMADVAAGILPGARLRQAREAMGLTVGEIAGKLYLTESAVCSLEADRYDELPGTTFVRGYIRTYAKLVNLDADTLAGQFSQTTQAEQALTFKPLPDLGRSVARRRSRGRLGMALLLLLVLIALVGGYAWWQDGREEATLQEPGDKLAFSQVEIERVDGTLHIQSLDELDAYTADLEVAEISLDSLVADSGTSDEEAAAEENAAQDADSDTSTETTAASDDEEVAEAEQAVAEHQLELVFSQECWIRITDGSGKQLASGLHQAGEVLQLSGDTPFELHIGNAGGVELRYNGQAVDFHSSIRGNVARLKLG